MPTHCSPRTARTGSLLLAVAALAALGCAPAVEETPPAGDALRVEEPRALATPSGVDTAAVYLTLVNPTAEDDVLLSASTPAARVAEVHETVEEDGMVRMEAFPEGMRVPAESRVELAPGGKHLMLLSLADPLEPGESIDVELHLEESGTIPVTVPVVEPGA